MTCASVAQILVLGIVLVLLAAPGAGAQERLERHDLVVYGATPGGIMAAVAAAREGASVVIVEPSKHLGGMVTGGLGATDTGNAATIGGYTREYFELIGKHYGKKGAVWRHEPHVAMRAFQDLLKRHRIPVHFSQRLREQDGVRKEAGRIASITTETGQTFAGSVFVDATYEGDLMKQAGVSYATGREGISQYNESRAGVRALKPIGHPGSAYDEKGLLPDVHAGDPGKPGEPDRKLMAYNFRLCMTKDPARRVPFSKPERYDPRRYALLLVALKDKPDAKPTDFFTPADLSGTGKFDVNNKGMVIVSTNLHNGSWGYPDGTYAQRQTIWQDHEDYVRGFFYFLANDPRLPEPFRKEAAEWGLSNDEFTETGHFPPQLYVRVARRMVGEHVMTENDLTTHITKPDPVALGSYFMDSHRTQRVVLPDGDVATEGGVGGKVQPYQIAYRSLTPKRAECENLLVPVCMSATNVAWCSMRMEPVFMMAGHGAGVAAAIAAKSNVAVQDVPYPQLRKKLEAQKQILSHTPRPAKPQSAKPQAAKPQAAAEPAMVHDVAMVDDAVELVAVQKQESPRLIGMKGQPKEWWKNPSFLPCFDTFGQFIHRDWPGKVHSETELAQRREHEAADLAAQPGPAEWNRFGGWTAGPQLKSTGFFRTEKLDGKWWLVDPEGRLFYSLGVNCVRKMDPTPIERRENYFADYPGGLPQFAPFVVTNVRASKADYGGQTPVSFNFTWANLFRKYGAEWEAVSNQLAHARLRSWGLNTIGNWSHEPTYLLSKTPYTVNIGVKSPGLRGAPRPFRDPFDPAFPEALAERVKQEEGKSLNDPFCLGYFVDNELPWGSEHSLGEWTLRSPADQPAKAAMVADLKAKYGTIEKLNEAWKTKHASWEALAAATEPPVKLPAPPAALPAEVASTPAVADMKAFSRRYAEQYFRTTRETLRKLAPNQLYLGCRFHTKNLMAREVAAKFCDVLSFNRYQPTMEGLGYDLDAPAMLTEFSFGAADRGHFYSGIGSPSKSQADRAARYQKLMDSLLAMPNFVGCHWFQYTDQPASGRTLEGENGNYGLLDIVDTPYPEMIQATRHTARRVYAERAGSVKGS